MAKKNRAIPLSLSFLDIMACGFGAVTLLFLIIRHNSAEIEVPESPMSEEVVLLQEDIRRASEEKTTLQNSLKKIENQVVEMQGLADRVVTQLKEEEQSIQPDPDEQLGTLRRRVEELENQVDNMEEVEFGDKVREFVGEGNRQYLTGLKLGGERVMILVDGSASMLADTVVNAVRRRNMPAPQLRASDKWQWTVRTVEWLLAQLPPSSRFQVYIFNTEVKAAVEGSEGEWLDAADSLILEEAVEGLKNFSPGGGTSLEKAFLSLGEFSKKTDNLFLLTDGLPTQGATAPKKLMVSGQDRLQNFVKAVNRLPAGIPVNTLLFPMEGDPEAAAMFWQLAINTNGAFLAPSRDWP